MVSGTADLFQFDQVASKEGRIQTCQSKLHENREGNMPYDNENAEDVNSQLDFGQEFNNRDPKMRLSFGNQHNDPGNGSSPCPTCQSRSKRCAEQLSAEKIRVTLLTRT